MLGDKVSVNAGFICAYYHTMVHSFDGQDFNLLSAFLKLFKEKHGKNPSKYLSFYNNSPNKSHFRGEKWLFPIHLNTVVLSRLDFTCFRSLKLSVRVIVSQSRKCLKATSTLAH